jgi:hypothetical protein
MVLKHKVTSQMVSYQSTLSCTHGVEGEIFHFSFAGLRIPNRFESHHSAGLEGLVG